MEQVHIISMNWRSAMLGLVMACTIIVLVYLYARQIERIATIWLSGFVLAGMATSIPLAIGFAGFFDKWPGLTFLPTQMTLFFGPLLFLHARSLMIDGPIGNWKWLLAPGIIYWIYQVIVFVFLRDFQSGFLQDHVAKWTFNDTVHYPYILPVVFYTGLLIILWAIFEIWRILKWYELWLEDNRSDDDVFRPIWLRHLIFIGMPLVLIWGLENILGRYFGLNYFERFWADFSVLFLLFFISVEALFQIQRPFPKMPLVENSDGETEIPREDWSDIGAKLKDQIVSNQWYLDADIALDTLARRVGTNRAYISRTINQGLGLSFSKLINGLRVEHAKELMSSQNLSLLDIALESGFGSKASFNRAFKHHTGETPSHYQKRLKD